MSIYTECADAARYLADQGQPFTDISVINRAMKDGWSDANRKEATQTAPMILQTMYRASKVIRYGVVPKGAPGTREDDYVRRGEGRLVYSGRLTGPKELVTPNGMFRPILHATDPIARNGRRKVSLRNDFVKWEGQVPDVVTEDEVSGREPTDLSSYIERLESDLRAANARNEELQAELERQRQHSAKLVTDKTVLIEVPVTDDLIAQVLPFAPASA
jgi:hypothetical protein